MKRLITMLLITSALLAKYTLTITVETESIKEAGKVEEIVLKELKSYKPKIMIGTALKANTIEWDSCLFLNDTIRTWIPSKPEYYRGYK